LPTISATGLPGYESVTITGVFAPARTPAAIIRRLHEEMVRVLSKADVKEKFLATGSEVVGSSPEGLMAAVKSEIARMGKVITDAGIRND
jgi:tripartite-type tricarboxylate transporter receptor subunit TctC